MEGDRPDEIWRRVETARESGTPIALGVPDIWATLATGDRDYALGR